MASHSPVDQNKTKTPPPPKIITLYGHISGQKNLIKLKIDWLEQVVDLKKAIKKEKERTLNHLDAYELDVYKIDIENKDDNGYAGLQNGWTLDQYPTEAWSRFKLKDMDYLHKLWSDGKDTPTNEMHRIHFLVVLPKQNEPPAKRQKMSDDSLIETLQQWTEEQATLEPPTVQKETLRAFGNSFPLQQCDGIFSSIRDRMLANFKIKMGRRTLDWKKDLKIPIIGAAPGTGKTSICSRMLQHLAHRAQEHHFPPSAHGQCEPEATPANYLLNEAKVDRLFWTEPRLEDFRKQLIHSNERRLTLTIDLTTKEFPPDVDPELTLAVFILIAYQDINYRCGHRWKTHNELISLLQHRSRSPLDAALHILRGVENDNIIVIHLDETQHVSQDILRLLVCRLVAVMGPDPEKDFPFIFPVLSGLSLETLLNSTMLGGAGLIRYTPPVLTVDSMLTVIDAMLSGSGDGATKPSKPLGLQMLLHDLRGPARYFQAALFILQEYSSYSQTGSSSFDLDSLINRNAMRAGLENADQNWSAVFDAVVNLTRGPDFIRDLSILQKDDRVMVELFKLDVLGKEIYVDQRFMINGKEQPLSYLIERGWLTICDFASGCSDLVRCRVFLPFLTVFGACRGSQTLILADHPGMVPLCKKLHWTQNEQYDAKTLQYKLLMPWVEGNSSPLTYKLSTIFGNLGAVADVAFVIRAAAKYRELACKVEKSQHLDDLIHCQGSCPTVYLNADKAAFADSFVFLPLEQPSQHQYHILCIQSKLVEVSVLSIGQVKREYEKVRLVCRSRPFTLVIAADRLAKNCLKELACHTDDDLKSHVLVLDEDGFKTFYGKPFAHRRRIMTGLSLPVYKDDS